MNPSKRAASCDRELEALVLQVAILRGEDVTAQAIARASAQHQSPNGGRVPPRVLRESLKAELRAAIRAH